jgi:hypothetical protein
MRSTVVVEAPKVPVRPGLVTGPMTFASVSGLAVIVAERETPPCLPLRKVFLSLP